MSHISVVEIEIRSLEALRRAAQDCGLEFREGQKSFRWYGRFVGDSPMPAGMTLDEYVKCEHAIGVTNNARAYEIGVARVGDVWSLRYDFWQGGMGLENLAGAGCQKLLQRYGVWAARMAAEADGMEVSEETLADGTIKLTCSAPQFEMQCVGAW